jgi:hypothetical protein
MLAAELHEARGRYEGRIVVGTLPLGFDVADPGHVIGITIRRHGALREVTRKMG